MGTLALAPAARSQVVQLNQNFEGTTAPGWVFGGTGGYTPTLTATQGASPGWLEMTNGQTNESTYAYDTTSFASANATISATFNYVSFNGTGADGLTFFLADAGVVASQGFSPGAYGGSLGYAQKTGINGLSGGYLDIGIDEYGNYSNPTEGRVGGTGFVSNAIAVRGPGSGTNGYNYLGGTGTLTTPLSYPGQTTMPTGTEAETIQMVLTSTNQLTVAVEFGNSGVFNTVFTANLSGYTRPQNLVMGFTAGTGSLTSTQEIQNVELSSVSANIWTNTSADSNWNTANDWLGNPAQVPSVGSDVLLNNAGVGTAQTINVGSNQILRSLQLDAPFSYTLNNGSIEFNTEGVPGNSGIIVTSVNGAATQTINSNLVADNAIVVQNNTSSALNLTGTLATGGNAVNFNGSGTVNESGVVSGTGSLAETGTGTTNLSGANTYSGGTLITSGTLNANNNSALGTGTVTLGGGTLASTGSSTISNAVTLSGNAALSGITSAGALTQSGGSYTLVLSNATQSGNVSLTNGASAQTLTAEVDSGTSTISGVISNGTTAGDGLTKTGNGTLVLGGVSTYTGATTVNGGTVTLGVNNAIGSSSAVALNNSTLNLNGYSDSVGALSFNNGTINFGSGNPTNTLLVNTISSGSGVLTINGWTGGSTTFAAVNSGVATALLNEIYFAGIGSGAVESGTLTGVGNGEGNGYIISPNNVFLTWTGADAGTNQNWNTNLSGTTNWVAGVPSTANGSTQKLDFTGTTGMTPRMNQNYYVNAIKFDSAAGNSTVGGFNIAQGGRTLYMDGNVPSIIQQSAIAQTISGGTVNFGSSGVIDVSGSGGLTLSSVISGAGAINKLSSGTLTLSGNNTAFSGGFDVQAGILSVSTQNAVLGTAGTTVAAGGTLQVTDARNLTNTLNVAGTGSGGIGAIDGEAGAGNTATLGGAVTLSGATTIKAGTGTLALTGGISGSGQNLTLTGAGNITLSGGVTTGTGALTLNGTGTTTLSGTNTYTGTTTVNSGTLDLNSAIGGGLTLNGGTVLDGASSHLASAASLAVNSGTFNLNNYTESVSNLSGIPGGTVALGTGTLNVVGTGASTFGGSFTGSGTLTNTNTGELILTGSSSSFTGAVTLSNGVIIAGASNATGSATVNVSNSGNFEIQGNSTLASSLNLSTTGASTGNGAVENLSGNNTVTGAVTLSANSRIQSDAGTLTASGNVSAGAYTLNVGGSGNTTLGGAITGTGAITKDGSGTLALGAANSAFTGAVTVSAGTLQSNIASSLSNASSITVNSGGTLLANTGVANALTTSATVTVNAGGTINLNGTADTLSKSFTDAGTLAFGTGGTLTLASATATSTTLSGSITGSGTLVIGANETVTLANSFSDPNLTIILDGGTLKLNGTAAGTTTSVSGNLQLQASSILDFTSPSGQAALLTVNGFTATGGTTLTVNGWSNAVDYFYSNTSPGAQGTTPIDQIVFSGYPGSYTHWENYDSGPGNNFQISPVPEPATYGAIFVGLALAAVVIRRRRCAAATRA